MRVELSCDNEKLFIMEDLWLLFIKECFNSMLRLFHSIVSENKDKASVYELSYFLMCINETDRSFVYKVDDEGFIDILVPRNVVGIYTLFKHKRYSPGGSVDVLRAIDTIEPFMEEKEVLELLPLVRKVFLEGVEKNKCVFENRGKFSPPQSGGANLPRTP